MAPLVLPAINLGALDDDEAWRTTAREMARINESIGFFRVVEHGTPTTVAEAMLDQVRRFFELDEDSKLAVMPSRGDGTCGYMPPKRRALAKTIDQASPPDLRSTFMMARPVDRSDPYYGGPQGAEFFPETRWPPQVAGMQLAWTAYYTEMERIADVLLRLFALALELPPGWFSATCSRHCSALLANHYPPIDAAPESGQLRAGPHSDYGSFTIVAQDEIPGLQVYRDGTWFDVDIVPDSFVVNLGDLIARWTNDRWVSTLHRVVTPEDQRYPQPERYSIAFFHQPDYDAVIECIPSRDEAAQPKYPPITSGENLRAKSMKSVATV